MEPEDARTGQPHTAAAGPPAETRSPGRLLLAGARLAVGFARRHRLVFALGVGTLLTALTLTAAFAIRYELFSIDQGRGDWLPWWRGAILWLIAARAAALVAFGLHRASWRFACARDAVPLFESVLAGSLLGATAILLAGPPRFPYNILIVEGLLCALLAAVGRFSYPLLQELRAAHAGSRRQRALIVGAGKAGSLTVRTLLGRADGTLRPVALLDDDPLKLGVTLHGVPVAGAVDDVAAIARRTGAEVIVLAVPTATASQLYRIVGLCRATGLPLKTIPDLEQILRSSDVVTRITDFRLEDLLARRTVRPEVPEIGAFLRGRTVLVTGAAGSIGSELCRQIAEAGAGLLICLDQDENRLFRLEHELRVLDGEGRLAFFLCDVKDRGRLEIAFRDYRPDVVFHAAAYKHVPILQHHPAEAIRNNVGGTRNVVELSVAYAVENFVLISTDKAVKPTSVMGATKRVAEHIVRAHSRVARTRFCTIRFGNVLGSNGSVVELFLRQIRGGRAVTVTHPAIERYFMTISEAVHLVLFAATMGEGGETFILDMGQPVKIDQLARQIVQLSGLTPDVDVPIIYTGLRPGEKLFEELWADEERPRPTGHPGVLVAPRNGFKVGGLEEKVARLLEAAESGSLDTCWQVLLELVPCFQGRTNGEATMPPPAGVVPAASRDACGLRAGDAARTGAAVEALAAACGVEGEPGSTVLARSV